MHVLGEGKQGVESWLDPADGLEKPVVQFHVRKNKESSYKGMFRMRLRPDASQLFENDISEADAWKETKTEGELD